MFGLFKNKLKNNLSSKIFSSVDGQTIPLENVNDPTFSQRLMGDGVAIIPCGKIAVAPCSGIISALPDTKHAFGIKCENGLEILVHVGIDTVNLKGKYFTSFVKEGDVVCTGDNILMFDLDNLKQKNIDCTTMMIVLNSNEHKINFINPDTQVKAGIDCVLEKI